MSYAERVRTAANPQAALLAVAEGIDAVLAWLHENPQAAAPADPWGQWDSPLAEAVPSIPSGTQARAPLRRDREERIAAVREQLEVETDGEERLALEARLRLLTDTGQALEVGPDHGEREQHDDGVVLIPPATAERQATRIAWGQQVKLHEFSTLPPEDFYPAWGKGGPMWMYAGNRDGVMQMPENVRRALIQDVMQDSDAAAQEMARDILKDTGSGNREVALEGLVS